MDIKCRKTTCQYNNAYTCTAENVNICYNTECDTFKKGNSEKDFSKNMFEADTETYANSRHIKDVDLECHSFYCLFNKNGSCSANGITVLDEGKNTSVCGTFIKTDE